MIERYKYLYPGTLGFVNSGGMVCIASVSLHRVPIGLYIFANKDLKAFEKTLFFDRWKDALVLFDQQKPDVGSILLDVVRIEQTNRIGYSTKEVVTEVFQSGSPCPENAIDPILAWMTKTDFFGSLRSLEKDSQAQMILHYFNSLGVDQNGVKTFTGARDRTDPIRAFVYAVYASGLLQEFQKAKDDAELIRTNHEVVFEYTGGCSAYMDTRNAIGLRDAGHGKIREK
jgi:hypothetical protein